MKIITNDTLYVQIKDLAYMSLNSMVIPFSLYVQILLDKNILNDKSKEYKFLKTDNPKDIEEFKKIDWIIDYNDLKDKSLEELNAFFKETNNKKNEILREYNNLPYDKKKHYTFFYSEYLKLEYKALSIYDFIQYRIGLLDFKLPASYEENIKRLEKK